MEKIKVAYSPDTDDAFMVHAMKNKLIPTGDYEFEYTTGDIQALNKEAHKNTYHITAISVAAYPSLSKDYLMMPIGASIGDQFGPAIVVPESSTLNSYKDLEGKIVACPGQHTSAFYAATGLFPKFQALQIPFDEIEGAVKSGKADAGILIHEHQLICEEFGLKKIGDLGAIWYERFKLPLPLGANAIKKSLGLEKIQELTTIYRNSISYGLEHRRDTINEASQKAKTGLVYELADQYIDRYVNHRSLDIQEDVLQAIQVLFKIGAENGLCDKLEAKDFLYH